MHNECTSSVSSLFIVIYLSKNLQTETKIILEKWTCWFITINSLLLLLPCSVKESHNIWSCNTNFASQNRNLLSYSAPTFQVEVFFFHYKKALLKCLLMVSRCPLSFSLERCLSYRVFSCSKMTEKQKGPTPGIHLIAVHVQSELAVHLKCMDSAHVNQA